MEIRDMIWRYNIRLQFDKGTGKPNGRLAVYDIDNVKRDNAMPDIKAHKPEILAELTQEWDAEQKEQEAKAEAVKQKLAKRAEIEGLLEIVAARKEWAKYMADCDAAMDDEYNDGAIWPKQPTSNLKELETKYPRAVAYLKAESYEQAEHYAKAAAGKKATARILDGEDYEAVLTDMEKEWLDHCNAHIWD